MLVNHQQKGKQSPYCESNHINHEAGHPQRHKLPLKKHNYSEVMAVI